METKGDAVSADKAIELALANALFTNDGNATAIEYYGDLREQRGKWLTQEFWDELARCRASVTGTLERQRDLKAQLAAAQERERVLREALEAILDYERADSTWISDKWTIGAVAQAALDATRDGGAQDG